MFNPQQNININISYNLNKHPLKNNTTTTAAKKIVKITKPNYTHSTNCDI